MKTLVIHPTDPSTAFLSEIYADKKDWTILDGNISKGKLKKQIKAHDRIIMLGHGTEDGLMNTQSGFYGRTMIGSDLVYLLRQKQTVCIWCNADVFVRDYELKGFHTGMIISEYDEAELYCIHNFSYGQIAESNKLFAQSIKEGIDSNNILEVVKSGYTSEDNPIIVFNKENVYQS